MHTAYIRMIGKVSAVYASLNDVVKKDQLLGELIEAKELRAKAEETKRTIRCASTLLSLR